ncbi:Protein kinase, catalytic domain-containing protein [Rozella allomycis CSF55]|uniref:non-specific serine/threonine protein kinase n=1 Tax=Rozella allomycis (strain CSF55) TaxID=988480 RepID=A0A075ARS6_ROZAC|nr:Protein kinase, catalytic domain-containing protein [Rozella allomycis CSF55]|eukprot:EPZ32880.1 Protein kinase, catalytic domain-containing protein [Rozella allomycis CSF55]
MDRFKEIYVDKCRELRIEPLNGIISCLNPNSSEKHPEKLDLSGQNLSIKNVIPIAEAFRQDILFTELDLSDSFLGDDVFTEYDKNRLTLEWNCLGVWETALEAISDALTLNNTLEDLDLRNNRISPQGMALLARGMKNNSSLQNIDLRWNNAGLIGGRALLDAVELNRNIRSVDLSGNDVPEDIMKAINAFLNRAKEKQRVLFLDQEFQQLAMTHRQHIEKLAGELDEKTKYYENTRRTLQQQIEQASSEIEKSHNSYRSLEMKMNAVLIERDKMEEKLRTAEESLLVERSEHLKLVKSIQMDLEKERNLAEAAGRVLHLEACLNDIELRESELSKENSRLIMQLEEYRRKAEEADSYISGILNRRTFDLERLKEKEEAFRIRQRDWERMKEDALKTETRELRDKINHLEDRLRQSESFAKSTESLSIEQKISEAEKRVREEEVDKRRDTENQYQSLKRQRDSLQQEFENLHSRYLKEISELESKLSFERKNRQKAEEEYHLYKNEHISNEKQLIHLQSINQEMQRELINYKATVPRLQEQLSQKEQQCNVYKNELEAYKEEEIQRMKDLESAISGYIKGFCLILNDDPSTTFTLLEKVGEGSYGVVYKAIHKPSGKIVAVKLITIENDLEDLLKEIDVVKNCDSPCIVKYFDSILVKDVLWIILEYCGSGSLSDIMKLCKTTINENQICLIMDRVLEGLEYLHNKGMIHRDIKAANILLNTSGEAKLADFGVVGQLSEATIKRSTVIQEVGYDFKADIWSVELAEGKPPYHNIHPMRVIWLYFADLAIFMIPSKPSPTLTDGTKYSDEFKSFISSCLTKNPKDRPTAAELRKRAVSRSHMMELVNAYLERISKGERLFDDDDDNTKTSQKARDYLTMMMTIRKLQLYL